MCIIIYNYIFNICLGIIYIRISDLNKVLYFNDMKLINNIL